MKKSPVRLPSGTKTKKINLALQGGGAHGAFTWGVLDRLLDDERIDIEGIVGTSAGAVNAAILAYGLEAGGRKKAKELLHQFWKFNSENCKCSPFQPTVFDKILGSKGSIEFSPYWQMFDILSRMFSPYQWNPNNTNVFKDILEELIDFSILQKSRNIRLYLCATNVLTGRLKVFDHSDITPEMILASACLPYLYQAPEINGEYYWDGGYMGNPPIFPVIYNTDCHDVLIVQINPINIPQVPRSTNEIFDRINTLSFNSSLMREMRAIYFVTSLIEKGELDSSKYKHTFIHTIDAEEEMSKLTASSKMNLDMEFLKYLFDTGKAKADEFLTNHFDEIGQKSSTDIVAKFF
ncbi:MAG: alpha/beta hydrolase [Deltaproteobacteria bacterium HGW-Deltaproteobacteria-6]|jgi:NTE family protein|nr:MAG: alpha/beta hydrolase [Deltaproteobacteria bacterium HGW-Deltaproteobacteria-6]